MLRGIKLVFYEKKIIIPYFEAHKLPSHMKPQVIAKLKNMIQEGISEKVSPGESKWALPIVEIRKTN